MSFKKIIPAALFAIAATGANAGGFDGPFVQLGIGGSSTQTKLSGTDSPLDGSGSSGSFNGLVAAGWSQSIGTQGFNLGANLFYVIGNQNAGSRSASGSGVNSWNESESASINGSNKLNGTFGISVEPGWNFTDSTLGFVKLAWVNSRSKTNVNWNYTCTAQNGTDCGSDSGGDSISKTINGFGYGLGVKQLVTKNIFVGVDLMGVTYGSATLGDGASAKSNQFLGFASVGYKF